MKTLHINPQIINKIKRGLHKPRILVVGDVMLDRYWFGDVQRISPEAPVAIANIKHIDNRPGGAANVAKNIVSQGGTVTLLSVVGDDQAATELFTQLQNSGIETLLKKDKSISTIVKIRVLALNQQLIRLDFENNPSHEILLEILEQYTQIIPQYDLVILSDYGKGGLLHTVQMIALANKHKIPILIDPKGVDYSKYAGSTLITPNKNELRDAVGAWDSESKLKLKVSKLMKQLNLKHLLLTRSEEGMSLFNDKDVEHYSTVAREIYDVSGAGDTVIATLGLMLANKINIQDAVAIANVAAGIVVAKVGTACVTKQELVSELIKISNINA